MDVSSKPACSPFFGCHFRSKTQFKTFCSKIFIFGGLPINKPATATEGQKSLTSLLLVTAPPPLPQFNVEECHEFQRNGLGRHQQQFLNIDMGGRGVKLRILKKWLGKAELVLFDGQTSKNGYFQKNPFEPSFRPKMATKKRGASSF